MELLDWHNCYEGGWQDMIVPEAFAHPAKFSRALVVRIFRHGLDEGYWQPNDLIGDPFGGIATGGLIAAYHGLRWVGVELEERFCLLGNQNIDRHRTRWAVVNDPVPRLVQGDSRRFAEIVGALDGIVSSPPFVDCLPSGKLSDEMIADLKSKGHGPARGSTQAATYGSSPGQIGSLPAGNLDGILTSPPYADSVNSQDHGIDWSKSGPSTGNRRRGEDTKHGQTFRSHLSYGETPGQIGALKSGELDGVVTSPPYGDQNDHERPLDSTRDKNGRHAISLPYGASAENIGNAAGETYWQAMRAVYAQMRLAMKPGAVAAIVLKNYVKAGKVVPLCDQTCTLLESLGFTVFQRCRCWLVKESSHPGLFDGEAVTKRVSRKSFFGACVNRRGRLRLILKRFYGAEASPPALPRRPVIRGVT